MSCYGNSTSHLPWRWHSLWSLKVFHFTLSYFTAFSCLCSQEPHLALLAWYTLCNLKGFDYKILIKSCKNFTYCFILSFEDNQEKSFLLPLGNLNTYLSFKDMGLVFKNFSNSPLCTGGTPCPIFWGTEWTANAIPVYLKVGGQNYRGYCKIDGKEIALGW